MEIDKISSIALTVSDLNRSTNFYTQALGCKIISDFTFDESSYRKLALIPPTKVRLVTLQLGEELIELVQYLDLEAKPMPTDSKSNDLWFQHLAIVVRDMDLAYKHLQNFAIESISTKPQTIPDDNPMAGGVRAFKFRDEDRHALELIWFPEDKGKAKWQQNTDELFLGIDHSAISIADTEESLEFYRNLLGLEVEDSNLNQGKVQGDLDGLPGAEVWVTPLQPVKSSIGVEFLDYIKPETGRPIPKDWQINDLGQMHLVMEVANIESSWEKLQKRSIEIISPNILEFPGSYRYNQGYLIKDPNGHLLLLVSL
ncbi:VOC family protein [Waterburya agarophytonicola K14]|uniref:VOC family protein n=1 Tax=Waterburya agarophytonicola KI4 TaxID=2874699 RepID=A0A964BMR9_9CYAN|nr:VOC family protein [Waterburya agarophytonicola]MCC0175506.1 VOC family protein [Waterburya agarophytonicola KI4]